MSGAGRALVLIGFMGAGKTSAARTVAAELRTRPLDTDALIERELGTSIEEWFATRGERAFRELEEEVVLRALEQARGRDAVLALGGGAVASERVQQALREHTVVLLDVGADAAWQRAGGRRPLARDRRRFDELHADRAPLYERLADAILPAARRDTIRRALPHVRALPEGTKLLWAESASGSYPVFVGDGLLATGFWPLAGRRFTVSDGTVAGLYGPADATFPAGERHKTLATVERVLRAMAAAGIDHDAHVAAVGGGVVGDVAGFCAAIYQRGIGVVQVPTTLVAQVDSAYGGKTGVDLPEGKNYAGAYHQPAAVVADPAALRTLPAAELAAGWAEVVKTGLIAGGALWRRLTQQPPPPADRDLIVACARTKLAVVAEDERDAGRRQALNLGHTVGHAIETATRYERYRHGEAVGLGLLAALTLSRQPRLRAEVEELLAAQNLPTRLDPAVDLEAVAAAVGRDKKRRGGRVGFVLVDGPGEVRTGQPVEDADLRGALQELAR
ncbi:MAG TPA: bifunctional shikimate kinase/3-dehydroquinate synthase [Solirubrobacteraceae bacterium]|nr:bifunctional shikimate kinase/3-dehydroquinate synthase [Solirubrobacteraceae bacterium]